ncbi:MAG: hypothetical protein ACREC0_06365 [Methylocella sp.]
MIVMRGFFCKVSAISLLLLSFAATSAAFAEQLRWHVTNSTRYRAQIDFYSENRAHEWPGGGEAWDLSDDETHTYTLNCRAEESICYGAWIPGHAQYFWGSGGDHNQHCKNCCADCGEGDVSINLVE